MGHATFVPRPGESEPGCTQGRPTGAALSAYTEQKLR